MALAAVISVLALRALAAENQAPDQVFLLDELGAEVNLARTTIHGAYVGDRLGAADLRTSCRRERHTLNYGATLIAIPWLLLYFRARGS